MTPLNGLEAANSRLESIPQGLILASVDFYLVRVRKMEQFSDENCKLWRAHYRGESRMVS